jgi:hypothetical protein
MSHRIVPATNRVELAEIAGQNETGSGMRPGQGNHFPQANAEAAGMDFFGRKITLAFARGY